MTSRDMIFEQTPLDGAYLIDLEKYEDERGFFARTFCRREFEDHGLETNMVQSNVSFSARRGTLRGMHFQEEPHAEAKLVRCTRGGLFDVIVDLRPWSATFTDWFGLELSASNYRMMYVPEGFAHGFITLAANTEVTYQVSAFYAPEAENGFRYDDPAIGIHWPIPVEVVSEKDTAWPALEVDAPPAH